MNNTKKSLSPAHLDKNFASGQEVIRPLIQPRGNIRCNGRQKSAARNLCDESRKTHIVNLHLCVSYRQFLVYVIANIGIKALYKVNVSCFSFSAIYYTSSCTRSFFLKLRLMFLKPAMSVLFQELENIQSLNYLENMQVDGT